MALPILFGGKGGVEVVGGVVVLERHVVAPLPLVEFARQVARRGFARLVSRLLETFKRALEVDESFGSSCAGSVLRQIDYTDVTLTNLSTGRAYSLDAISQTFP